MENQKLLEKFRITVILFIFFAPFFKGLFAQELFYAYFILLLFIMIGLFIIRNKIYTGKGFLLVFILQFSVSVASLFTGINKEGAINGVFVNLMPLAVFLAVLNSFEYDIDIISTEKKRTILCKIMDKIVTAVFLSGSLVFLINLLVASRIFKKGDEIERFQSVIEYANVLGVFFFICSIAGLYLSGSRRESLPVLIFIKTGISLNMAGVILTYSRTVWILSVLFYFTILLFLKKKRVFYDFMASLVTAAVTVWVILTVGWNYSALAVLLSTILIYFFYLGDNFLQKTYYRWARNNKRNIILVYILVFLVVAFSAAALVNSRQILSRLASISINASELQERFAYYIDSISILKDYPILGTGPGGWASIQYHYQTALYAVQYIHSSYVQAAVDYGITGFMIFGSQLFLFVLYLVRAYRRNKDAAGLKELIVFIGAANIFIMVHSLIDLDFEFPFMEIYFWVNTAFVVSMSGSTAFFYTGRRLKKSMLAGIAAVLLVVQVPLMISRGYLAAGKRYYANKQYTEAETNFSKAVKLNPVSSNAYFMRGEALRWIYMGNKLEAIRIDSINCYKLSRKYDNFNPNYPASIAFMSETAGDYENSVMEYRKLIELQPLVMDYYEALAEVLIRQAEYEYENGMEKKAIEKFEEITAIEDEVKKAAGKLSYFGKYKSKHKTDMSLSSKLEEIIQKARKYVNLNSERSNRAGQP